ncbi:hypothetical protein FB004_106238 [Sinorhizobium medicae]|nr:hypothetical protein FB004_106238 [Sinorhizobium medicae]TWA25452.1 hypothetical protein FB006_105108 [Sinorhizobium medicae]TWA36264.1 hypothetical protein FB007_105108 [Sinorhizobium medicae]TWA38526.1 hypothetical protein FB009_107108 [Sinorhizobium medicae]TWA45140.1 hypothetical protein FB005_106237 [Sinorhizobium medicae]
MYGLAGRLLRRGRFSSFAEESDDFGGEHGRLTQPFLSYFAAKRIRPDGLACGNFGEHLLAPWCEHDQLRATMQGVFPIIDQIFCFENVGDALHALSREPKRTGGFGNRHVPVPGRGQDLPASAGLAGRLREPISFGGQVSCEPKDGDRERGERIARRSTRA